MQVTHSFIHLQEHYIGGRSLSVINYLDKEHGLWRDLHIVAKFEVREEGNSLCHAHVAIDFEADDGDRRARHN
jgi:hypothetical protein